jgi:hypothetical protein
MFTSSPLDVCGSGVHFIISSRFLADFIVLIGLFRRLAVWPRGLKHQIIRMVRYGPAVYMNMLLTTWFSSCFTSIWAVYTYGKYQICRPAHSAWMRVFRASSSGCIGFTDTMDLDRLSSTCVTPTQPYICHTRNTGVRLRFIWRACPKADVYQDTRAREHHVRGSQQAHYQGRMHGAVPVHECQLPSTTRAGVLSPLSNEAARMQIFVTLSSQRRARHAREYRRTWHTWYVTCF